MYTLLSKFCYTVLLVYLWREPHLQALASFGFPNHFLLCMSNIFCIYISNIVCNVECLFFVNGWTNKWTNFHNAITSLVWFFIFLNNLKKKLSLCYRRRTPKGMKSNVKKTESPSLLRKFNNRRYVLQSKHSCSWKYDIIWGHYPCFLHFSSNIMNALCIQ